MPFGSDSRRTPARMIYFQHGSNPIPGSGGEAKGCWLTSPGRFSFKSWVSGEMVVPESALAELAVEGIAFSVEGPAT